MGLSTQNLFQIADDIPDAAIDLPAGWNYEQKFAPAIHFPVRIRRKFPECSVPAITGPGVKYNYLSGSII